MENQELLNKINNKLQGDSQKLIDEMKQIVNTIMNPDAVSLEFEIFPNGPQGYNINGFLMDKNYSQIATLPMLSWAKKGILRGDEYCLEYSNHYPPEPEEIKRHGDFEEKVYEIIIYWFFECWKLADGQSFKLKSNIRIHDSLKYFDLINGVWVNE